MLTALVTAFAGLYFGLLMPYGGPGEVAAIALFGGLFLQLAYFGLCEFGEFQKFFDQLILRDHNLVMNPLQFQMLTRFLHWLVLLAVFQHQQGYLM